MTYFSLYYLWSALGYTTVLYPTIDKQDEVPKEDALQEEVACTNEPAEVNIFPDEIESSEDEMAEPLPKKKRKKKRH